MIQKKQKSPVSAFLVMAAFNLVGAIAFTVFYFLYKDSGGENSHYLLVAAIIAAVSAVACLGVYSFFKKKLGNSQ